MYLEYMVMIIEKRTVSYLYCTRKLFKLVICFIYLFTYLFIYLFIYLSKC